MWGKLRIDQFIRGKKAIYFVRVEGNAKQNLENFSKNIMEFETGIYSFQSALEYGFKLAEKDCLVSVGVLIKVMDRAYRFKRHDFFLWRGTAIEDLRDDVMALECRETGLYGGSVGVGERMSGFNECLDVRFFVWISVV